MKTPDKHSIDRTLNNSASKEEAKEVLRWFATPEGSQHLSRLIDEDEKKILPGTEEHYIEERIPSAEMYERILSKVRWQHRRRLLFRAAAILIPLILFAGQFWYLDDRIDLFSDSGYEEVYVPRGERSLVIFQDGSRVSLNSESRIRYPRKFAFSQRKVFLEGEGFFEVASNKNRPFIVDLNGIDVKVLGTTFDVKAYSIDPEIFVTLETGKVFLASQSRPLAHLKPGDKAVYNRNAGTCKISRPENVTKNSAWRNNQLVFENTPLAEVIQLLSRWYNIEFSVADSSALYYNYTLTSSKKQINQVLLELEKIAPVRFTDKDGTIQVTMKK